MPTEKQKARRARIRRTLKKAAKKAVKAGARAAGAACSRWLSQKAKAQPRSKRTGRFR